MADCTTNSQTPTLLQTIAEALMQKDSAAEKSVCGTESVHSQPKTRPHMRHFQGVAGRLPAHQLHQHDDQERGRHESTDEDSLIIEVRLPCKCLPVLLQVGVDPLGVVHNSSCMQGTKLMSTPHM